MTKNRLLVVSVLLSALLGIGLGVTALIPEGPGVTKGNFDRIENGMTRAEVEEIFGEEADRILFYGNAPAQWVYCWECTNGQITMRFDEFGDDGKLLQKQWYEGI